jgi:hypothetical protein
LTATERLRLNHPNAVLRKFKAATEIPDAVGERKPGRRDIFAEQEEEIARLKAEIARLKAHIAELEAARET